MYRYIGNKTKLSAIICDKIEALIGNTGTVADIMCGTGNVALALKNRGYRVIASDVMTYAYIHAYVNLFIEEPPSFKNVKEIKEEDDGNRYYSVIQYLNNLDREEGYFFKEFSPDGMPEEGVEARKYFTSENAKKIDAIRRKIKEWEEEGALQEDEINLLKHDLILSVNRFANISGTYGHYHSTYTKRSLDKFYLVHHIEPRLLSNKSSELKDRHRVMQGYAEELCDQIHADLVYIDPPYMKRQYAANYHILETLARGDEPPAIGKSGLRPWRDQYSNFCSKVKIRESFNTILRGLETEYIVVSYSEDGLLSKEEMIEILSQYGTVTVEEIQYSRFKSNQSTLDKYLKEYLFVLKKN